MACLKGEQRVRRPWWAPSCLSVVFVKAAKRNRQSRVVSLKLESWHLHFGCLCTYVLVSLLLSSLLFFVFSFFFFFFWFGVCLWRWKATYAIGRNKLKAKMLFGFGKILQGGGKTLCFFFVFRCIQVCSQMFNIYYVTDNSLVIWLYICLKALEETKREIKLVCGSHHSFGPDVLKKYHWDVRLLACSSFHVSCLEISTFNKYPLGWTSLHRVRVIFTLSFNSELIWSHVHMV